MSSSSVIFDFEAFYRAVDLTREARGLNWKQVGEQTSIHPSTLARMGQNKRPDADGLASLSAWSGLNPAEFVDGEGSDSEPLARISQVLRKDRRLSSGSAKALEEIIRSAYSQLIKR
jgi:hypothetical protein